MGAQEFLNVLGPGDAGERLIGRPDDCGTCESVSSDGRQIATLMGTADGRFDFYVINTDGTGRREFPLPPGMQFGPGPFSGAFLYVGGFDDKGSNGVYRLTVADFGGLTRITHTPDGQRDVPVDVSADGSHLLVFRPGYTDNGEHGDLYLTDTRGDSMRRLNPVGMRVTLFPIVGSPGSFSPDSKSVAFAAYEGDQGQNINPDRSTVMVADVAGGTARPIGKTGTGTTSARWSPTGDVIAFQRSVGEGYDLYLIRPDGTGERQIREARAGTTDWAWVPVWSPTGAWLAFQRGSLFQSDLWAIRRDGSGLIRLTAHPAGYGGVTWAP